MRMAGRLWRWRQTAQFKGIIKVTAVNCNTQKKICDEYGVKEFPTLKVSLPPPSPLPFPPSLPPWPYWLAW